MEKRLGCLTTPFATQRSKDVPPKPMNSGPAMMFVDLVPDAAPDGKEWRSKDIDALSARWSQARLSLCV